MSQTTKTDVNLSKTLSYLLRHSAGGGKRCQIQIDQEGFASVDSILSLPQMRSYTMIDIERVVRLNDKQRFAMQKRHEEGCNCETNSSHKNSCAWYIRANQGHSFALPGLELKQITLEEAKKYPEIVHATCSKNWPSIRESGLSRMNREYIHFLPRLPSFEVRSKMSGKLKHCDLFIFLDIHSAMINGGLRFYLSMNNIVLCPGNEKGLVEGKYFAKVLTGRKELSELENWECKK